jgi:hypothetical protein
MFVPRNPRVPGVGVAPQRARIESPHAGLVDALFARRYATDDRRHVVVRSENALDRRVATPDAERRTSLGVPCGQTTAEA